MPLLDVLPAGLRPYAKAVAPAFLALLAVVIHAASSGTIDRLELEIAVVGLLAASVAFGVDNAPAGVRGYAKSLAPAVLTAVGVGIHFLVAGEWDQQAWAIAATGLGSALVTLLVPNIALVVPPGSYVRATGATITAAPAGTTVLTGETTSVFEPLADVAIEDPAVDAVLDSDLPSDDDEFGDTPEPQR